MNDMQEVLTRTKQAEARREMTKYSDIARRNASRIKRKESWEQNTDGII
jgi:hypothetical protein